MKFLCDCPEISLENVRKVWNEVKHDKEASNVFTDLNCVKYLILEIVVDMLELESRYLRTMDVTDYIV